jgi:hypothetical protein
MAIQDSFIKIKGTIGGLTFYERDGQSLIKTQGGVDKKRILNDPNYRRTRENMQEFGASAVLSKSFRIGFSGVSKEIRTVSNSGRIVGMMKRLNRVGLGNRGERSFEILPNKQIIIGFEFQKKLPFNSVFYAPNELPVIDANRSVITWTIPDFNTQNYIQIPKGATHARLVLHAAILSDYVFDQSEQIFRFVHPDENEHHASDYSVQFPLTGMVGSDIVLTADFGLANVLPDTAGILIGTGILFYQQINGLFYALANNNSLQIATVV